MCACVCVCVCACACVCTGHAAGEKRVEMEAAGIRFDAQFVPRQQNNKHVLDLFGAFLSFLS